MKPRAILCFLVSVGMLLSGCIKDEDFSDIPAIEYEDFILYSDLSGELVFTFTDGDGDVGLRQEDTVAPFNRDGDHYYNFYMDFFVKENGEFVKKTPLIPFNYRIPFIQPEGKNKTLQGTISIRDITPFPPTLDFDTVKFQFYMEDRSFQKSNVQTTRIIIRPR